MRDARFAGAKRFSDFLSILGLAPSILATRLDGLVSTGLMERGRYSEHPDHYEYLADRTRQDGDRRR